MSRSRSVGMFVVALLGACGNKTEPAGSGTGSAAPPRSDIRIAFGDCAPTTIAFASGQRPLPFDPKTITAAREPGGTAPTGGSGSDDGVYGGLLGNEVGETSGGVGYSNNGFGSIGTRAGENYGVGRMPRDAMPRVTLSIAPTITGELDKAIIRRYLKQNLAKLAYCYEKELLAKPALAGDVDATFEITATGTVKNSKATGVDPTVSSCIARVISQIAFPRPKSGTVTVRYPMKLDPPPKLDPSTQPQGIAQLPGRMQPAGPDKPYVPGADNPMRSKGELFAACFGKSSKSYGVMVVDLTFDATGVVTDAIAHGVDDATVKTCVVAAAKQLKRDAAPAGSARCSVAFGTMPVVDAPGVDITDKAISWRGKELVTLEALKKEANPPQKVDSVFDVAGEDDVGKLPVSIRGPIVIRAVDATPMALVNRSAMRLMALGRDPVFAAQLGGGWQLLRPIELPVVPVPESVGGSWRMTMRPELGTSDSLPETAVHFAILVTADSIYVGTTAKERGTMGLGDWNVVDSQLASWKAKPELADLKTVEIAGADAATYGNVVRVIHGVMKAGFTEWLLTDELVLSVKFR